ncbi:TetR/AcrR family transcriptional regulator [Streptomyces shenzhenensis]|uniref:TetR family transcriptional regulator n=1 Tax=Streptomyces shenzhenensis TaxID=943815 RepID=A0A3M0HXY8_9ACTN|nr:TetR/AcrR family transcriptional regulator [Streptomyces shenzhenensis]RMB81465.1 TetR family transcriptional regulator [Streptomyces shenzhenensis]
MPRAGLDPASVTEAAATLVDEIGFAQLSMGLVAERLGVRTPSLYKHVTSQADLAHRIAVLAATELGDAIRDATQGRVGGDALAAAAQAMRTYVREHPGRYAALNSARPDGPDDPFVPASARALDSLSAVLRGYHLDPAQEIHALRMLRSTLHGFATLEVTGGFQHDTDVDDSFIWMITFIDRGLRAATATPGPAAPTR